MRTILESEGAYRQMQRVCYISSDLNIYKYLNYLLEQLPGTVMTDEELAKLVPWNETVQTACSGAM